jgi:hypothetical protein
MSSRRIFEADDQVIAACRARGVEVSARQLERWRKLLPVREVEHPEGARGSRTANPEGYADQVIAISRTLASGTPLRHVPLVLFVQGRPVRVETLRSAYLDLFTSIPGELQRLVKGPALAPDDPADRVDAIAMNWARAASRSATGRQWQSRARLATKDPGMDAADPRALLSSALSAVLTGAFTGTEASPEGIAEALAVFGLDDGRDPRQLAQHLAQLNFDAIVDAIRSASMERWDAARNDLAGLLNLARTRRRIESRLPREEQPLPGLADALPDDPLSQAIQIPALLITFGDEERRTVRTEQARWEALDSLLSALPENAHRPVLRNEIPDELGQELAPLAQKWVSENPEKAAALSGTTPSC